MDISNSLVTSGFQNSAQPKQTVKSDLAARPIEKISEPNRIPSDPAKLERKSAELQLDRVQRVNSLESAPLRNQQAVTTYHQTIQAAQEYEQGELVGIDLFV